MRSKRRRMRQQRPQSARAVPEPAQRSLEKMTAKLVRTARAQGYTSITQLGDERNQYQPLLLIEFWPQREIETK